MRPWWRRFRGWVLFVGAAMVGAVCGVLAGALLSDRVAGAVVGVVTAVLGVLGARGKSLLDKRSERKTALPELVQSGRLTRVKDLTDPVLLGVHPAAADESGRVPPYVARDVAADVDSAITAGGFVLLSGESAAGKSRLAFEAIRRLLPDHVLVAPVSRESVKTIVEVVLEHQRCVLWLDDIERFFGQQGLTVPSVNRMVSGGAVLLGTIRTSELERFGARRESELAPSDRDGWRTAREVLRLAVEIAVPRRWSEPELDRARSYSGDRRIRSALAMTEQFGLAELLADGPELVRDWRDAWRVGGHPRGAALVAAAVDCRRAGVHDPVPVELLATLAEHYLAARGGAALRPESHDEAVVWATRPARGASSLLMPAEQPGHHLAFDYLIDLPTELVPIPVWTALIDWSEPEQALEIGLAARRFARFDSARAAFGKAADANVPGADVEYADEIGGAGHPELAITLLTKALAGRDPLDLESLRIRGALARYTQSIHQPESARRMFAALLADCDRVLGHDHPDTLAVRRQATIQLANSGERQEAAALLADLVADHLRVQGPDHQETMRTRHQLAIWTGQAGDPTAALAQFADLLADRTRLYGPDHPNGLSTRFQIALWTSADGRQQEAFDLFEDLLQDSIRLLGASHPHTVSTRYRLGICAREIGQPDKARAQWTIVHEQWSQAPGPEHSRTLRVRKLIDDLPSGSGEDLGEQPRVQSDQ